MRDEEGFWKPDPPTLRAERLTSGSATSPEALKPYVYRGTGVDQYPEVVPPPKPRPKPKPKPKPRPKRRLRYHYRPEPWSPYNRVPHTVPLPEIGDEPEHVAPELVEPVLPPLRKIRAAKGWKAPTLGDLFDEIG